MDPYLLIPLKPTPKTPQGEGTAGTVPLQAPPVLTLQHYKITLTSGLQVGLYAWTQTLTTTRNPLWRLEGAYRCNPTSSLSTLNDPYSIFPSLISQKTAGITCRCGAVEGFVRVRPGLSSSARFRCPRGEGLDLSGWGQPPRDTPRTQLL